MVTYSTKPPPKHPNVDPRGSLIIKEGRALGLFCSTNHQTEHLGAPWSVDNWSGFLRQWLL